MKHFLFHRNGARSLLVTVLVTLLASASTYAASPAVGRPETAHYRLKSRMASATWETVDSTQCTTTNVYLFVSDSATVADQAGRNAHTMLSLNLYQTNWCTGTEVLSASAYDVALPDGALQFKSSQVTLSGMPVSVVNATTGDTLNLTVSAAWTATSSPARSNSSGDYSAPGYHSHYHTVGRYAEASATASVRLGDVNYTPGPSEWASTSVEMIGNMTISHPSS